MTRSLFDLADRLPASIRRRVSDASLRLVLQILAFGTVGAFGFVVDTATVYLLRASLGLYGAGAAAYLTAATATWALNRWWTFRGQGGGPAHQQWARFMMANLVGFAVNRGVFFALVATVSTVSDHPVLAVAAGAIAGMGFNFRLSKGFVFR